MVQIVGAGSKPARIGLITRHAKPARWFHPLLASIQPGDAGAPEGKDNPPALIAVLLPLPQAANLPSLLAALPIRRGFGRTILLALWLGRRKQCVPV